MSFIEVEGLPDPIDMGTDFDTLSEEQQHELIDKKVAALRGKQKVATSEAGSMQEKFGAGVLGAVGGIPAGYAVGAAGNLIPNVPEPRSAAAAQFKTPVEVAERAIAARQTPPTQSAMPQEVRNWVETQQGGTKPEAANYKQANAFAEEALRHETANPTRAVLEESRLSVPKNVAAQISAEKAAAAEAQALKHQQEVNAVAKLRAERLAELKNTVLPGEKALASAGKLGSNLISATKSTIPRLAGHVLSGAGVGLSAADVADRIKRGEYGRAAISALGGAGDVATMTRHPVAVGLGLPVGVGAPIVNMGLDALLGRSELPVEKAEGGEIKKPSAGIAGALQQVGTVKGPNLMSMAQDYIAALPEKTAQNAIRTNEMVQKSNPYSFDPRKPTFDPNPNYDPQAAKEFNEHIAGNFAGAIKNVGGNWLEHGLRKGLDDLKFEGAGLSTHWLKDNPLANRIKELQDVGYSPEQINEFKAKDAVNNWTNKTLKNYTKNDLGTPNDPVRQLADKGISHINELGETWDAMRGLGMPQMLKGRRALAGFPEEGYAQTNAGKAWERKADESIIPEPISKWVNTSGPAKEQNPWIDIVAAKDPNAVVHSIGPREFDKLGFAHLTDELKNAAHPNSDLPAHLRLKPEALERVTVPQAVERVAKINAWRQEQMAKAAQQNLGDFPVVHQGAGGFNIHELKMPEVKHQIPEGTAMGKPSVTQYGLLDKNGVLVSKVGNNPEHVIHNYNYDKNYETLEKALKNEGDQMGHCVGGYCDEVASGKSRIFSLRDPKGAAHATIEAIPREVAWHDIPKDVVNEANRLGDAAAAKHNYDSNHIAHSNYHHPVYQKHLEDWLKNNPKLDIAQIKGKQNGPVSDKYRQDIKDFLNKHADQIASVRDLENVGLHRPGSDLTKGGPLRDKVISSILEKRPDVTVSYQDLVKHVGNKFYSSADEIADDYVKSLISKDGQMMQDARFKVAAKRK